MEREFAFTVLSFAVCGVPLLVAGLLPLPWEPRDASRPARALERTTWRRLAFPFLVALVSFSALFGWWAQEPNDSEALPRPIFALAALVALVLLRALVRAAWALRPIAPFAGTTGVFLPRVHLSEEFREAVDADVLRAAREHEEAHARHHDPLRILVAQLITDLQLSLPRARQRMNAWREALELARDEEARERGVHGADLAQAVLQVVRLQERPRPIVAALGEKGLSLPRRIARLCAPLIRQEIPGGRFAATLLFASIACTAASLGATQGERVIQALAVLPTASKSVSADEAPKHVGEIVTVSYTIAQVGSFDGALFLNSKPYHKGSTDFVVYVPKNARDELVRLYGDDLKAALAGKKVRVTGEVTLFKKRDGTMTPEIVVRAAAQLQVVPDQGA